MGVVCCEAPPKLAHQDAGNDPSVSSAVATSTTAISSSISLPSGHVANDSHPAKPKSKSVTDQDSNRTKTNKSKTKEKKSVRICDNVTMIPLLTSASFFHKTPKPTTITNTGHGIMPSFRIVAPAAIRSEVDKEDGSPRSEDNLVPKASLWWTKQERKEIQQANQKCTREFKRFQPTKMRQVNLVYNEIVMDCCHRNNGQEDEEDYDDNDIYEFFQKQRLKRRTTPLFEQNRANTGATSNKRYNSTKKRKWSDFNSSNQLDSDLPPPTIPDFTIDLPASVRGLEWGVIPDAKRYRKAHARNVLGWQDRLRCMNNRQCRRNNHDCDDEEYDLSSSSSSSEDDSESDSDYENCARTSEERHQQDILLGEKASLSSLRSCILAKALGKYDAIAANPTIHRVSNLEGKRSTSPTPSLEGTSESSSGSEEEECDNTSDSESDSDSDNDDDDNRNGNHYFKTTANYKPMAVGNSRPRFFRPRMMPSWR